ncbi:hypothetical protein [Candidatus Pyrohabitans sp.]
MISMKVEVELNEGVAEEWLEKLDAGLDDLADFIFERSQELVAQQSTDTGALLKSGRVERGFLKKEVVYDAAYAAFIEYGTEPHMPPVEPLKRWAKRHGMDEKAGWAIAMKIKKEGTEPKPFLRPAFDEGAARAKEIIRRRFG